MSMQLTIFEHNKTEKQCGKCKEIKTLLNFCKNKYRKDGLNFYCRQCVNIYYKKNKEAHAVRMKVYRENNKEIIAHKAKVFYQNNKEEYALRFKVYSEKNKEVKRQYDKVYFQKNKEHKYFYIRQRIKSDPLFRLTGNLRKRVSSYCKKIQVFKNFKTMDALGCTSEQFKQHLESKFTEGMTWENYGAWHVDHIKPISLATNEQEAKELNHFTNLQPLWAADNLSKGNNY